MTVPHLAGAGQAGAADAVEVVLAAAPTNETHDHTVEGRHAGPREPPGEEVQEQMGERAQGCSLSAPGWKERVGRWARVLTHATTRTPTASGVRVTFDPVVLDDDPGELVALVRAEHDCCASLQMTLHVGTEVVVEVRTPDPAAEQVTEALFAPFTPSPPAQVAPATRGARQ